MNIPKSITNLIESFQKLPGIGPKTAQRLTFYLLHIPQTELDNFASTLTLLKKETILCTVCKNVSEQDPCPLCSDAKRDKKQILVVEQPLDLIAFEKTGNYGGVYHVLHGRISPLENIGPDEIFIDDLLNRVKTHSTETSRVNEVIIATNPTMEGEATAMFLNKKLKTKDQRLKVTRLGMGIPTGADLEYADEVTLKEALDGRKEI